MRESPTINSPANRPAFVVHDLAQARAALAAAVAAGVAVRLDSAPGAAGYAGAGWWAAVVAEARAACPTAKALCILDCGAEPGLALGAIRQGVEAIRCTVRGAARARLRSLAAAAGVAFIEGRRRRALDLATVADPDAAASAHLARAQSPKRP